MIITNLKGGMGNQMFQYAIGRGLSLRNNTECKLDLSYLKGQRKWKYHTFRNYELGVFNIQESFATKEDLKIFRRGSYLGTVISRFYKKNIVVDKNSLSFDPNISQISGDVYLDGFWQNEKYFADCRDQIRKDFTLRKGFSAGAQKVADEISRIGVGNIPTVSIHVRRGDYVTNPFFAKKHGFLTVGYFIEAIQLMQEKLGKCSFFIFSDDIPWAKEHFAYLETVSFVSGNDISSAEDMILMSKCSNHIISNSSFSWWGAWLGQNPLKIVIAPKKWVANLDADDCDVVPKSWIRI